MIKGLHHNAYRCRDSEETRKFYEDFLGLPLRLAHTDQDNQDRSPGQRNLHTFYEMDDGSYLAFFEAPDQPFEFKQQHDFDLHIALEVDRATLERMFARARRRASRRGASPTTGTGTQPPERPTRVLTLRVRAGSRTRGLLAQDADPTPRDRPAGGVRQLAVAAMAAADPRVRLPRRGGIGAAARA